MGSSNTQAQARAQVKIRPNAWAGSAVAPSDPLSQRKAREASRLIVFCCSDEEGMPCVWHAAVAQAVVPWNTQKRRPRGRHGLRSRPLPVARAINTRVPDGTCRLPPCDIPSGCCSFTGPWTVTRSSLRMLRRIAAFCRPLRPVLLLVSFPRSTEPSGWCTGAVLDVAGCAVCASAAPNSWRIGVSN